MSFGLLLLSTKILILSILLPFSTLPNFVIQLLVFQNFFVLRIFVVEALILNDRKDEVSADESDNVPMVVNNRELVMAGVESYLDV